MLESFINTAFLLQIITLNDFILQCLLFMYWNKLIFCTLILYQAIRLGRGATFLPLLIYMFWSSLILTDSADIILRINKAQGSPPVLQLKGKKKKLCVYSQKRSSYICIKSLDVCYSWLSLWGAERWLWGDITWWVGKLTANRFSRSGQPVMGCGPRSSVGKDGPRWCFIHALCQDICGLRTQTSKCISDSLTLTFSISCFSLGRVTIRCYTKQSC